MYNTKELVNQLNTDWKSVINKIISENQEYFEELQTFLDKDYKDFEGFLDIYPPNNLVFNCFNQFNVDQLKVVILGQDPYHSHGQAMGLSFSVPSNVKLPPSLKRIYKEINEDLKIETPSNGDLTFWSQQGVLLLNTALTVRQNKPNSHSKIWKTFTTLIINYINNNTENIIFLLWGNHAKSYKKLINLDKHHCLESSHPSPLARTGWFGCKHFSKTNEILSNINKDPINWSNI